MCNGFGLWDLWTNKLGGYGIFPSASLFNHSCVPNLCHDLHARQGGGMLVFRALMDVKEGDELFSSYLDLTKSKRERSKTIQSWCFNCRCLRCNDEKTEAMKFELDEYNKNFLCLCGNVRLSPEESDQARASGCTCPVHNML
eukprot:CAMPEP_0196577764 /NCGR_PEP_ID=MMETSP1081-20130531/6779_1 /TAXON_ID=36882 /ORGANISM="Pyramimonas amylifera, Strain CCMP720" /LENGTH=141 /DNA_ID=CAMNT_0041896773 /DNA_START=144 /DNA_END=566 /DNA_ORIENTATION=+